MLYNELVTNIHRNRTKLLRKWKTTCTQYSVDIKRIVSKWKQAVMDKEKEIENARMLMDITGVGPQQMLNTHRYKYNTA